MPDPAVSIGMPVYNGMPYLREAIATLLAQTFRDFELIISDNASTDGSWELIQAYADADIRIRATRNETNIGAAANFNAVLAAARAPLFAWAASDDTRAPRWLEALYLAMTTTPTASMAQSGVDLVLPDGSHKERYDCLPLLEGGEDANERLERFQKMNGGFGKANIIYGLCKAAAMREVGGLGEPDAADVDTLEALIQRGPFIILREYLFCKRVRYVS